MPQPGAHLCQYFCQMPSYIIETNSPWRVKPILLPFLQPQAFFKIAKTVSNHNSETISLKNTWFKLTVFFSSIKHRICHVTVPFQLHLTHCCSNKDSQCWRRSWSFSPRCWGISWEQNQGLFAPHKPRPRPTDGECLQMTCSLRRLAMNKWMLFFSTVSPAEAIWNFS